jgi:hypothetical protein
MSAEPYRVNRVLCPVEGCPGSATSWANFRRHFMHRHFRDVIVILEEGPLPRCKRCGMHVRLGASAARHFNSDLCRKGVDRNRQRLDDEEAALANEVRFSVKGVPFD